MSNQEILEEMVRRISELERTVQRMSVQRKRFEVLNVNEPAQLTGEVNDYDPGDYDLLRMTSNGNRTIKGISGGVPGRVLILFNLGSNNIILAHASASSLVSNRIYNPGNANITMAPRSTGTNFTVYLCYTSAAWISFFMSEP